MIIITKENYSMDDRECFFKFVRENCGAPDSGTASSYKTAIEKLCVVFAVDKPAWAPTSNVWEMRSPYEILQLRNNVKKEQAKFKKSREGIFAPYKGEGDSYFRKYWCVSALAFLAKFREAQNIETAYELQLESAIADTSQSGTEAAKKAARIKIPKQKLFLPEGLNPNSKAGKEIMRQVRVRCNQRVFRKAILNNYQHKCCVCGLAEDEVLDAAHINEWASDLSNALDATNGLCLSATYHRAFDAHLIGFDEKYRLRLSKALKSKCTRAVYHDYFTAFERKRISLPVNYKPDISALVNHLSQVI